MKSGKIEHRQLEAAAIHFELRFLQVALLLLKLYLGLDHIRVRHLAALFQFLADIEKAPALAGGALRGVILPLRHHEVVIGLDHRHHQPAGGDFGAGPRHCFRGPRAPIFRDALQRDVLVNIALAEILVHSVGAHKAPGGCAIALGIKKSGVVVHPRQQGGAALYAVFFRGAVGGQGGVIYRIIFSGAGDGILQGHGQGSRVRGLIGIASGIDRREGILGRMPSRAGPVLGGTTSIVCRQCGCKNNLA